MSPPKANRPHVGAHGSSQDRSGANIATVLAPGTRDDKSNEERQAEECPHNRSPQQAPTGTRSCRR